MGKTRPPYPAEFREQMVELVRAGRTPAELAREFDVTAQTIANWVGAAGGQASRNQATTGALSGAEREETCEVAPAAAASPDGARHPGKGYGLVRRQERQDVHTVFELVNANQADFPVRAMCRVLGVSHSGFYDWQHRAPSQRAMDDMLLTERIRQVHADSRETYGRPRVRAELAAQGVRVGGKRIARLMRRAGLQGISKRRASTVTTRRDPRERPAADLVRRCFCAERANQLWVADMTYVPTWAGFIYLAVVMDVFSRRIVGWSMGERMKAELVLAALNMALAQRKPHDVIHHSDQGSQYTSLAFGQRCAEMGVRPSMGSVGDAYDNAMAESFFATLECELIERRSFRSKTEAKAALFSYIEGWYNPRRRHSALGYHSPVEFERRVVAQARAATEINEEDQIPA